MPNQDIATKNYVDTHAFTTAGGVVSGDIKLGVGSDLVRSLGCIDLSAGEKFTLLPGSDKNMLTYSVHNLSPHITATLDTETFKASLTNYLFKLACNLTL